MTYKNIEYNDEEPSEIESMRTENASLRAEIAQTEFRNERLVSDYASIQEELSTIRRIHVQNIAIKDAEIARWKTVPMKYRRMEFNAQLQEENASLKERVVTLEKLQGVALIESLRAEAAERRVDHMKLVEENHELRQQLSASQLEAKRLRDTLQKIAGHPEEMPPFYWWQIYARNALSSPTSTEALDAYVAEIQAFGNTAKYLLSELLAVLHGDGGHHEDKVGTVQAVEDAMQVFYKRIQQRDLAVSAMKQAREALMLPGDRWNKTQFEIVQSAIDSIDSAIKESALDQSSST